MPFTNFGAKVATLHRHNHYLFVEFSLWIGNVLVLDYTNCSYLFFVDNCSRTSGDFYKTTIKELHKKHARNCSLPSKGIFPYLQGTKQLVFNKMLHCWFLRSQKKMIICFLSHRIIVHI